MAGKRQTGSDGAVEGGRVRGDGLLAGSTSGVAWRGSVGRKGVERAWGAGESAVLQSGKCCAFTGLAAFAASPEGIRRLPVSKLPASVGFLPVALLIVMQHFNCSC